MDAEAERPDARQLILSVLQAQLATYEVTGELVHRSDDPDTLRLASLIRTLSAWQVAAACDAAPGFARVFLDKRVPTLPDEVKLLPAARLTKGELLGVKTTLDSHDWFESQLEHAPPLSPQRMRRIMTMLGYVSVDDL